MAALLRTTSRTPHFSWLASALLHGTLLAAAATIVIFPRTQGVPAADEFEASGSLLVEIPEQVPTVEPAQEVDDFEPPVPVVEITLPALQLPEPQFDDSAAAVVLANPLIAAPALAPAETTVRAKKAAKPGGAKIFAKESAKLGSGFRPAQRAAAAPPAYPVSAKKAGITGTVIITLMLNETGHASAVSITKSSGNSELDEAALRAARAWRFRPATHDERPVATKVTVPVRFALS